MIETHLHIQDQGVECINTGSETSCHNEEQVQSVSCAEQVECVTTYSETISIDKEQVKNSSFFEPEQHPAIKGTVQRPYYIRCQQHPDHTVLEYKWPENKSHVICTFPVVILWNTMVVYTLTRSLYFLLVPHTWFGIYCVWYLLQKILNTTVLTITETEVKKEVGPLTCNPLTSYSFKGCKEIQCKEKIYEDSDGHESVVGYEVRIVKHWREEYIVIMDCDQRIAALFVAQEINRVLKTGEFSPV